MLIPADPEEGTRQGNRAAAVVAAAATAAAAVAGEPTVATGLASPGGEAAAGPAAGSAAGPPAGPAAGQAAAPYVSKARGRGNVSSYPSVEMGGRRRREEGKARGGTMARQVGAGAVRPACRRMTIQLEACLGPPPMKGTKKTREGLRGGPGDDVLSDGLGWRTRN